MAKNIMAQLGWATRDGALTDDDYRSEFDIPEDQDVNEFMFNYARDQNINYYMTEMGMDKAKATAKANARLKEFKSNAVKAGTSIK